MKTFSTFVAAATLAVTCALTTAASAADIFLQSMFTHGFVRDVGGLLVASGNDQNAQRLEIVRLQGNRVALRAPDGSYVRAGVGPGTRLATGSPHIRGWETFEMNQRPNNRISLRSTQNGRFVVSNRTGELSATAAVPSEATVFRVANARSGPLPPQADSRPPRFDWVGEWRILRVADDSGQLRQPPRGLRNHFTVGRDMRVAMSVGCNRISSRLDVGRGRDANFSQPMMTKMLCGGPVDRFERNFTAALDGIDRYEYREGQIAFLDRRGRTLVQIGR